MSNLPQRRGPILILDDARVDSPAHCFECIILRHTAVHWTRSPVFCRRHAGNPPPQGQATGQGDATRRGQSEQH